MAVAFNEREIKFTLGEDYLETASRNATASPHHAIEEFVANAWDADARVVRINYDGKSLTIQDDGQGMSPEEVEKNFFKVGESMKKNAKSHDGREFMGSFGLAKLGLRQLAHRFILETEKSGQKSVVSYKFPEQISLNDPMRLQVFNSPLANHGMRLHLEDLVISPELGVTEKSILHHLATSMPVEDPKDFSVIVNFQMVTPVKIENADTFDFKFTGSHLGNADGIIYLTKTPVKEAGVYIRVNKRNIGNPQTIINLHQLNDSTARRIVARITADGLSKFIRSDRGGFRPCAAYQELVDGIHTTLSEVNRFAEYRSASKKSKTISSQQDKILKEVYTFMKLRGVEEIVGGGKLTFSNDLAPEVAAHFDDSTNTILLNNSYPTLSAERMPNSFALRQGILMATVEALSEKRAGEEVTFELIKKNRVSLLDKLQVINSRSNHETDVPVFPSLRYELATLAKAAKRPLPVLRYLADRGVLTLKGDRVAGGEYLEVNERTKGLLPLPEFLRSLPESDGTFYSELNRLETIFNATNGFTEPFVLRWLGERPAYFIEQTCVEEVRKTLESINLRSHIDLSQPFKDLKSVYLSMKEVEAVTSLRISEIQGIISYATSRKINIKRKGNEPVTYEFGDLIRTLQESRENKVYPKR